MFIVVSREAQADGYRHLTCWLALSGKVILRQDFGPGESLTAMGLKRRLKSIT